MSRQCHIEITYIHTQCTGQQHASNTNQPSTEMSWMANRRMMVQIIPRVIFMFPSTISAEWEGGGGGRRQQFQYGRYTTEKMNSIRCLYTNTTMFPKQQEFHQVYQNLGSTCLFIGSLCFGTGRVRQLTKGLAKNPAHFLSRLQLPTVCRAKHKHQ